MVKVLIFDMDGTLIDTDQVLYETWKELFLLYKSKDYVIDREFVRGFSGPPIEQSIARAFPEMDGAFILKEYRARTQKYYDLFLKLYPGELEILEKLYNDGYIFAIATSKNKAMAIKSLEKYNLLNYFSFILTSSDNFKTKPDPEMINFIQEKTGYSKEEIVMIGDTRFDYLAAKNANVKSILFKGSPRIYEDDVKPDAIVNLYDEMYEIIKKH